MLGGAPPPVLSSRAMSLTLPHWIILVVSRNVHEKRHISCFLIPIIFIDIKGASSVGDRIWTQDHFDEFRSSSGQNSAFAYISILISRVANWREAFSPSFTILLYFIFESRAEIRLQIRINVADRQLYQNFQHVETFLRLYDQFQKNDMQSFVPFVLGFYLNFLIFFKVLYEFGSMENQCSLDRAAHFRPRLPFGVCLKLYD